MNLINIWSRNESCTPFVQVFGGGDDGNDGNDGKESWMGVSNDWCWCWVLVFCDGEGMLATFRLFPASRRRAG